MGKPKLLLDVGGRPMFDSVLDAWTKSDIDHTIVVVREDDTPLVERCDRSDVSLALCLSPTYDMRASVEIGLQFIERVFAPLPNDAWLVAPADMPGLRYSSINRLLACYDPAAPRILVPRVAGRPGHPVVLPWSTVPEFQTLAKGLGLDTFLRRSPTSHIDFDDQGLLDDIDTQADYEQWSRCLC